MDKWQRGAQPLLDGLRTVGAALTDEQAVKTPAIFLPWDMDFYYAVNERVRYNGALWRCLQSHLSQASWQPGNAPSLWTRIDDPDIEWPQWAQPGGSHDAYALGAKVSYAGKRWVSTISDNIWTPGAYGWEEVEA